MTEAIFALGRGPELVGRTRYCDQPPEAAQVAIVGGFSDPSIEAIVALSPSLVCGERGPAGPDLPRRLGEHGIATYFPELDRVAQVEAMLVELGERLDASARGRELARALRAAIDEVAAGAPSSAKPRVVLLFDLDPLVAASDDCFPGELLALAGAENPVKGPSKYPRLGAEGLLALDPDVIIDASSMVRAESARDPRVIVPGFAELRAVRKGRLRSLGSTASLRAARRGAARARAPRAREALVSARAKRDRADVLLVERSLAPSRARAQAMILAGEVYAGESRIDKPGQLVDVALELRVSPRRRFVSRGGEKLDGALRSFGARFDGLAGVVAVDVGASTGGFSDCLLQRGASKVYAVDVGWGQLDDRLRRDPRVVVRERTNARSLGPEDFAEPVDLVVVDASFIGLDKLLPAISAFLRPGGELVALVKPQFEAGREAVSKGRGVIRDREVREAAIASARGAIEAAGFELVAEVDSEVVGPKGNVERFVHAKRRLDPGAVG